LQSKTPAHLTGGTIVNTQNKKQNKQI
jgi:hypothetical protein